MWMMLFDRLEKNLGKKWTDRRRPDRSGGEEGYADLLVHQEDLLLRLKCEG